MQDSLINNTDAMGQTLCHTTCSLQQLNWVVTVVTFYHEETKAW